MYPTKEEFENWSDRMIAAKYACSVRTVQRWRKKLSLKRPGWGPGKLRGKAREIRLLYNEDKHTQEQLARMFGVSQAAIGRIVNNLSYPERSLGGLSGECPVVVEYRVG